jgi:hypothetical protein
MEIKRLKISEIKLNPNNPRTIKDEKFKKLVNSIKEFPEMLEIRPIVVNADNVVLGGNMRLRACKEAGMNEIPVIVAYNIPEERHGEFIIKDNVGYGDWDWDMLANEWDMDLLKDWGLDVPSIADDDLYTTKVESPIYEPTDTLPDINLLYNLQVYNKLIDAINNSGIEEDIKQFLRIAATRHIEFNYREIANFYANTDKESQSLMEDSALVIIDYKKAIEKGFVKLYKDFENLSSIDE